MTQAQLERAIARATGETIATIQRHGFSPMKVSTFALAGRRRRRTRRHKKSVPYRTHLPPAES